MEAIREFRVSGFEFPESSPPPFDYEVASEVALAVIRANWQLANRTGLDAETLRCELAAEIWEGYEHFDPRRSSFKTFAGNIAWKRLIDRYRRRSRVTAREMTWGGGGGDGGIPKEGWCRNSNNSKKYFCAGAEWPRPSRSSAPGVRSGVGVSQRTRHWLA